MSVIAANAGEEMAEPGDNDGWVVMLAADKDDFTPGRDVGTEAVVVESEAASRPAGSIDWGAVEVDRSVSRCRPALTGECRGCGGPGVVAEGLRMWNLGMESK